MASLQEMLEEMLGGKSDFAIPKTKAPESTQTYLDSVDYSTILGNFNPNNPMMTGSVVGTAGGGPAGVQLAQMPYVPRDYEFDYSRTGPWDYSQSDIMGYLNQLQERGDPFHLLGPGMTTGNTLLTDMIGHYMGFGQPPDKSGGKPTYNQSFVDLLYPYGIPESHYEWMPVEWIPPGSVVDDDDDDDDTGSVLDDFEESLTGDDGEDIDVTGLPGVSDIRLKENIELVGNSPSGVNIYEFDYKNKIHGNGRYRGVMAQEVPESSFKASNGYLMVDYSNLDVKFERIK